jgi:hypothetical protein
MNELDKKISIELSLAEAIVIANFVGRHDDFKNGIANLTNDEKRALWNLECLLEKELTEPFVSDYEKVLEQAKKILTDEIDE